MVFCFRIASDWCVISAEETENIAKRRLVEMSVGVTGL